LEALDLLQRHAPKVIAGCTDYFPSRPEGRGPDYLMDVTRVAELRGISNSSQGWRIGAATTWTDILRAPLPAAFDGLKLAAREVGSIQIQNQGTIAGNLCNASPAADGVPPLLALDARVEVASADGRRVLPLAGFITGVRQVDLRPGEMVMAVHVPPVTEAATSHFLKLGSRTHLVISIAMVAVVLEQDRGCITRARIAVGSCAPVAQRLPALEARVAGMRIADLAGWDIAAEPDAMFAPLSPISDVRGSAAYRAEAVAEMCRRALIDAARKG
jgi:CO/xanthine dehydrogenase FAD-binding subunit